MDAEDRRRLDRIDQALFGPTGNNGLYGEVREIRLTMQRGFDELREKQSSVYRMLATAALTLLVTGVGVVLTMILTTGAGQ